jgi:hypothetical protein
MRRCIATGVLLGSLLLASCGLASTGPPTPASGSARLVVTALHPVTIRGSGFKESERVKLVLLSQSDRFVLTRVADGSGSFTARYARSVLADRCTGYVIEATGSLGSTSAYRSPLLACSSS